MIFEQIATGGCQSYLLGCQDSQAAVLIDPELSRIDHYKGLLTRHGLSVKYIVDTHTHAISSDHDRYPLAPVGGKQSDWSAHRPSDYESLLAAMDAP